METNRCHRSHRNIARSSKESAKHNGVQNFDPCLHAWKNTRYIHHVTLLHATIAWRETNVIGPTCEVCLLPQIANVQGNDDEGLVAATTVNRSESNCFDSLSTSRKAEVRLTEYEARSEWRGILPQLAQYRSPPIAFGSLQILNCQFRQSHLLEARNERLLFTPLLLRSNS